MVGLSQRDTEVVAAAFQCLKTASEIDYDKLATMAGYKNGPSARACFREVKKKLLAQGSNTPSSTTAPTATKKRASAKKRKQSSPEDSSPPDSNDEAPAKKRRITKAKSDEDEEDEAAPLKNKYKPKPKGKKPRISSPETEEDKHNANAIAAGRARYAADKLVAEIKKEVVSDDEEDAVDGEEEPMGMNIDSGEDEGMTAYDLINNEIEGDGIGI
ncbi:hypothetical protein AUEXF2481DRAFT_541025 [Aureobasidium subglaciale EXF-2481]|uniref:Uncharacterized protein n=1 Tax=Aureobasidium subglaciale (strain EXF-2481) TaxID=1043005 RepID=A0A074YIU7_AURSE|nr:uncharacterized protein AUEXF2481DRAFT_541025 [Aureobasidium subglaciale EXF-2481]KAI5196005.1 hypothetical protein E4T38_08738 [Aureobasidium subglaciale]KAI5215391.1 hypothetical protein E4T40_08403 [Aureobasidium subglaciale]KAI5217989.1 hypothetical protein E4T41_08618 [Aureobasidium subglaciale]KAI5255619.1 hypothetical protein E4T46_08639 [Aureobasidium subglaciale]KEQ97703.1 hypothetical protein AUEXF2481DRAFT_541025 [Aureobasidium subglaciale EXF-2481]